MLFSLGLWVMDTHFLRREHELKATIFPVNTVKLGLLVIPELLNHAIWLTATEPRNGAASLLIEED